jgi:hypothetical protein
MARRSSRSTDRAGLNAAALQMHMVTKADLQLPLRIPHGMPSRCAKPLPPVVKRLPRTQVAGPSEHRAHMVQPTLGTLVYVAPVSTAFSQHMCQLNNGSWCQRNTALLSATSNGKPFEAATCNEEKRKHSLNQTVPSARITSVFVVRLCYRVAIASTRLV